MVVKRQTIGADADVPTFSFKVPAGDSVHVNAATGAVMPGTMVDRTYRLDSVIVKRVLPPGQTLQRPAPQRISSETKRSRISRHPRR